MAQRRMFSLKIVASDAFLDMPTSSRELYFQLGMYADDDGFVNPRKIIRMVGASEDDIKLLIGKRFLLQFDGGVVVVKHWLINNLVRKDFYQPTLYIDEKNSIKVKDNKAYTECLQIVNNLSPQDRIGKDINTATPSEIAGSNQEEKITNTNTQKKDMAWKEYEEKEIQIDADYIEKDDKKKVKVISSQNKVKEIYSLFTKYDFDMAMFGINKTQRKAAETLYDEQELEQVDKALEFYSKRRKDEFCPDVSTPWDLASKWGKLLAYKEKTQ